MTRQPAQVMVLFAVALLAIAAMLGLVIDGGNLYLQRRTAQTAADAAALAGARALTKVPPSTASDSSVGQAICTYAQANQFGIAPTVTAAYYVDTTGATIRTINLPAACGGPGSTTLIPATASGVRVDLTIGPFNTYLVGMLGIPQLSASATASAQVGLPAIPSAALTPLAGCGPDMLLPGYSGADNILSGDGTTTPYTITPSKIGGSYILQGSQVAQNESVVLCPTAGGASWKGKLNVSGVSPNLTLPAVIPVDNGNGTIDGQITGACSATGQASPPSFRPPPDGCFLLVPIAAPPNPAGSANIVLLACFSMYSGNGTAKWSGVLRPMSQCPFVTYAFTWTHSMLLSGTQVMLSR